MRETLSIHLVKKILSIFLLLMLIVGIGYIVTTVYFTQKYFAEITQKLNAEVASHLINEKFQNASPFLVDGTVNKPLFGDIMHDMMAVNRGIEVYLLSENGTVEYSVVLDHERADLNTYKIDTSPIKEFIQQKGSVYILGEDPRKPEQKKIFSAAPFNIDGREGYIYIILASQEFEAITNRLANSYFLKLGVGAVLVTIIFASIIGVLALQYLAKNLKVIINSLKRFKEGDLSARIPNAEAADLQILAVHYNEMADTIVQNIEAMQSVEALRRELIANVSHDLRTPLAIMQGYVETLQIKKGQLDEDQQVKYLGIIERSIANLSKLINQLFEYSKLEAKQIEPNLEPFALSDLAFDVFEKYENMAKNRGIAMKIDVEEALPLVYADISLVERVLQNLLDNALKFTSEGGSVTLGIHSNNNQIFVAIKDTGKGIAAIEVEHIFERFKKVTNASKNVDEGAGLGLAIVRKILEIHNSSISVKSQLNAGTTFEFYLPAVG